MVLFVNDPELLGASSQRYLVNHLGRALPFSEVPIELVLRSHHKSRLEA